MVIFILNFDIEEVNQIIAKTFWQEQKMVALMLHIIQKFCPHHRGMRGSFPARRISACFFHSLPPSIHGQENDNHN